MSELLISNLYLQTLAAFVTGILGAIICALSFRPGRSMLLTCALLPPLVCAALLAVNGSVGTSIAVLGVFGLVRFRSLPAKGTDMLCIIYSMVSGLLCACGAWVAALVLCVILGLLILLCSRFLFAKAGVMQVQIVVPESMPDEESYTELLRTFGSHVHLEKMKTAGMGTLYELTYTFRPKADFKRINLLDEIRIRNGNLSVTLLDTSVLEDQL